MSVCIALVRGINVGRGNRVSMADLRALMADLGHTHVRTLLNSGNLLFKSKGRSVAKIGAGIQAGITAECGFSAAVMVMTAQELNRIVAENPLLPSVKDHAKHLVAFVAHPDRQPSKLQIDDSTARLGLPKSGEVRGRLLGAAGFG